VTPPAKVATIQLNGAPRAIRADQTVAELIGELALAEKRLAVEVNLDVVAKRDYGSTTLRDGDRVEIVSFVGGG
jgi:thiamine biosynthesis protein ThiS